MVPPENMVFDSGVFRSRAETATGLDPISTIEFKFTVLTLEPNWDLDGISLSSLGSILAGRTLDLSFNDASNLSLSGLSATIGQRSILSLSLDQHPSPLQAEAPLPSTMLTMIILMDF